MGKYQRLSGREKLDYIKPILKGITSCNAISKISGIDEYQLREWMRKYNESGINGLEPGKGWKQYSAELKLEAVEDVIVRGMSKSGVVRKHKISSRSVLSDWINCYNSGKQLEATSSGRVGTIMIESRKTTWEERIEIAQYTIETNLNYKSAMEKYTVSYQQVYSWVNKYKEGGPESLKDNRGRKKNTEELTELELLKLENSQLKARNEYLEMESAIEKKLGELQHRYANIH